MHSVLLDTSFFIRLLNDRDPLHKKTKGYYKYFLENDIILKVSTISIAEYCVKGSIDDLPLKSIQIIPFNLDHAEKTGQFAEILFNKNGTTVDKLKPRNIIPNDSKLFSQADLDKNIGFFVTSDSMSIKALKMLKESTNVKFDIIDIHIPFNEQFGILDL